MHSTIRFNTLAIVKLGGVLFLTALIFAQLITPLILALPSAPEECSMACCHDSGIKCPCELTAGLTMISECSPNATPFSAVATGKFTPPGTWSKLWRQITERSRLGCSASIYDEKVVKEIDPPPRFGTPLPDSEGIS